MLDVNLCKSTKGRDYLDLPNQPGFASSLDQQACRMVVNRCEIGCEANHKSISGRNRQFALCEFGQTWQLNKV